MMDRGGAGGEDDEEDEEDADMTEVQRRRERLEREQWLREQVGHWVCRGRYLVYFDLFWS